MRLSKPRVKPLADNEMNDEQRDALKFHIERGSVFNIFRTLARKPKAYGGFTAWGRYILSDENSLTPRDREIVILRAGFNWKAGYEWAQHVRIGKQCGLSDDEINQIKVGPSGKGWTANERALLQAVDELTANAFVSDETWAALSDYSEEQRMDLVFTCGQYSQVCMMLNTFGVQLDDGLTADPDLSA